MKQEVKVPSVGESITTADIESWEKQSGDFVKKGEVIVLLATDKASMELAAEQEGQLTLLKKEGEAVSIGEVIAHIETTAERPKEESTNQKTPTEEKPKEAAKTPPQKDTNLENQSPAVRHLLGEQQLNPENVQGTGKGNRITKEDVLKTLSSPPPTEKPHRSPTVQNQAEAYRKPMSRLRKKTAERLVLSQQTTATLSTFNEVDMSQILSLRKQYQDEFTKKNQVKLGFMSFFVKAVVAALKEYPQVNAFIDGTDIVYNPSFHIGIAVSTEKGLVVPVIRNAETLRFSEIEKEVLLFGEKARQRKLTPDELTGGTFTISNGGVFGSLLSTPILNPPQSGILGMHKIEKRPVVIQDKIVIRPMMYLTLSYDHRIVDGKESVGFLVKVKEHIENPARILIDI